MYCKAVPVSYKALWRLDVLLVPVQQMVTIVKVNT